MWISGGRWGGLAVYLAAVTAAVACGDDPLPPLAATDTATDIDLTLDSQIDVKGQPKDSASGGPSADASARGDGPLADAGAAAGADSEVVDGKGTDGDATAGSGADIADGAAAAGDAGQANDSSADVAVQDFVLVSSAPAAGAEGLPADFALTLTFSTKIKPESWTSYTVDVLVQGDTPLPVKFSTKDNTATITAKQPAPFASRIDVVLKPLVQSNQGVPLAETHLRFYTAADPQQQDYADKAARFAPLVRQAVAAPSDLLRKLDFDGNWNAHDNAANQGKSAALAEVAWAAVETHSHTYLTYVFYWPQRTGVAPGVPLDNDVAGAQVVVSRKDGLPVALQTWFKAKSDEQMWLWLAAEAGWPAKSKFIRGVLPRDSLFPPADAGLAACKPGAADAALCPRRYLAYLTAASHQSCLWIDKGEASDQQCVASDLVKAGLNLLVYAPAAQAAEAGKPTAAGTPASYVLRPLLGSWWPHRDEAGSAGLFVDTQFTYAAAAGRPMGSKEALGSRLVSAQGGDFGRPPWAWQWKPTTLSSSYYDLPRGTPFLDPAWLLWHRLGAEAAALVPWNAQTKQGFSTDYCFNPYLGIDLRSSPACQVP